MPWINSKVELKLKLTKHCVSAADDNDNTNENPNNISNWSYDTTFYVPIVTVSAKYKQKYQNFLGKDLKDEFIGISIKQKVSRLFVLIYLNEKQWCKMI